MMISDTQQWIKGQDLITVNVKISIPQLSEKQLGAYACSVRLSGYEEVDQDIFGAGSLQCMYLGIYHAKCRLEELIKDGFVIFDEDQKKALTRKVTQRVINAIYGQSSLFDRAHVDELCLQAIERLQQATGTAAEQDADLNFLLEYSPDPHISDYIYHHRPELTAEEILAKAHQYRAIKL